MYDVVTIGSATRDVFLQSGLFMVVRDPEHLKKMDFPEGVAQCFALGSKIELDSVTLATGGGAANAAVTFARQGLRVSCVAPVGDDEHAAAIHAMLQKEKVESHLVVRKAKSTAYSAILLDAGGERTILNYRGASEELKTSDVSRLPRTQWFYIVPGKIPISVISTVVARAKKQGSCVAINLSKFYIKTGGRALLALLRGCDVVIVNREEAALLTNTDFNNHTRIFTAFDAMVPGWAVVTDGAAGVRVSDGKRLFTAGIFHEKKVVDRTGAGDAFGSAFVATLAQLHKQPSSSFSDEVIREAIRRASANATSVVEYIGATQGILTKSAIRGSRWQTLRVTVSPL